MTIWIDLAEIIQNIKDIITKINEETKPDEGSKIPKKSDTYTTITNRIALAKDIENLDHAKLVRTWPIESNINERIKGIKLNELIEKEKSSDEEVNINDEEKKKLNIALIWIEYIFKPIISEEDIYDIEKLKEVLKSFNKKDENGKIVFKVPVIYTTYTSSSDEGKLKQLKDLKDQLLRIKDKIGTRQFRGDSSRKFIDKIIGYLGITTSTETNSDADSNKSKGSLFGFPFGGGKKSKKRCNKSKRKNKNNKTRKAKPKRKSRKNSRS
tara:strand:- start:7 stop:810 length:804 start_codon:yes stop_codon:yes gene_type:complete